jgi:hypothetical protein
LVPGRSWIAAFIRRESRISTIISRAGSATSWWRAFHAGSSRRPWALKSRTRGSPGLSSAMQRSRRARRSASCIQVARCQASDGSLYTGSRRGTTSVLARTSDSLPLKLPWRCFARQDHPAWALSRLGDEPSGLSDLPTYLSNQIVSGTSCLARQSRRTKDEAPACREEQRGPKALRKTKGF